MKIQVLMVEGSNLLGPTRIGKARQISLSGPLSCAPSGLGLERGEVADGEAGPESGCVDACGRDTGPEASGISAATDR